jgi:hypothetical protein
VLLIFDKILTKPVEVSLARVTFELSLRDRRDSDYPHVALCDLPTFNGISGILCRLYNKVKDAKKDGSYLKTVQYRHV